MNLNKEHTSENYPSKRDVIFVLIGSFVLLYAIGSMVVGTFAAERKEVYLIEGLIIVPALYFTWKRKYSFRRVFRLYPISGRVASISIGIGLCLVVITDIFELLVRIVLPEPESINELEKEMSQLLQAETTYDFFIIFIAAVVIAGICEEMLFRGFFLTAMEQIMDVTRAIILVALFFSFIHFIWLIWPWVFIQILFLGVILGVLSWKSNSIIPPIIVHIVNNGVSFIITNKENLTWFEWKGISTLFLLVCAIIVLVHLIRLFYQAFEKKSENISVSYD